jgi:hypothetical protein
MSLSTGFGCTVKQLAEVLLSLDLEQIHETDRSIMIDSNQYLREYVCSKLGEPCSFTSAYWFHGTRTFPDNAFQDGLLPLEGSVSRVMDMLIAQAPDAVVRENLQAWNFHAGVPFRRKRKYRPRERSQKPRRSFHGHTYPYTGIENDYSDRSVTFFNPS